MEIIHIRFRQMVVTKSTFILQDIVKKVNVVLPSQINNIKVTTISEDLFKNNDLVKSITLSKNIKDVYGRYFKEIIHLEELKVVKENPNYTSSDGVLFDKNKRELVCFQEQRQTRAIRFRQQ